MSATLQADPALPWGSVLPFQPFQPLFYSGDLQTVACRYWPARLDEARWPTEERIYETEPGVRVLTHWNRQNDREAPAAILAVHGLTASSEATYMRTLAQAALEAGFDVIRLNVRNCGGTEHLCPTLYHSGLTTDLRSVAEQLAPRPLFVVGFSMGGNLALKLAGEWCEKPPAHVRAVCGISVPIQLAACVRRLGEFQNRIYELRFVRALRRTFLRKCQLMPQRFRPGDMDGVRTIYQLDDRVTAPAFGFRNADDYYAQASSYRYLQRIRVPTLMVQAKNDPFIPFAIFEDSVFRQNPFLRLLATAHGGHVAFLARRKPRFWAAEQAVRFCQRLLREQAAG